MSYAQRQTLPLPTAGSQFPQFSTIREPHQSTLHSCKPAEMPLPLPTYQGERPAHPTPPLATKPPGPYDTRFQDTGRKHCFPQGALQNSWERMAGTSEGLEKLLGGHVIPVPFSQGLCWPFGKRPRVPPLSSPASKLLFGQVEASQAEAQRSLSASTKAAAGV